MEAATDHRGNSQSSFTEEMLCYRISVDSFITIVEQMLPKPRIIKIVARR